MPSLQRFVGGCTSGGVSGVVAPVVKSSAAGPESSATTAPPPRRGTIVPTVVGRLYVRTTPVSRLWREHVLPRMSMCRYSPVLGSKIAPSPSSYDAGSAISTRSPAISRGAAAAILVRAKAWDDERGVVRGAVRAKVSTVERAVRAESRAGFERAGFTAGRQYRPKALLVLGDNCLLPGRGTLMSRPPSLWCATCLVLLCHMLLPPAAAGTIRSIETIIGHGVDALMVPVVLVNMSDGLVGLGQVRPASPS